MSAIVEQDPEQDERQDGELAEEMVQPDCRPGGGAGQVTVLRRNENKSRGQEQMKRHTSVACWYP